MPLTTVMSAGNCTLVGLPGITLSGAAVIVTTSVSPSKLSTHEAFVPHTISAVVCGEQVAGGADWFAGAPQSLSTTRMRAPCATIIALLKVAVISSPASRMPELPPSRVRTTELEVGAAELPEPKTVASTSFE